LPSTQPFSESRRLISARWHDDWASIEIFLKIRSHFYACVALTVLTGQSIGCGISWKAPTNHFDGVNERGFLSYWEQIGEFDFGGALKIPLILNFRSNRDSVSPYGGYGWLVVLPQK